MHVRLFRGDATLRGQCKNGKEKHPTRILEAWCSHNLRIWHAFFGLPGALNDLNVLAQSHLLRSRINGTFPEEEYEINGTRYNLPYWFVDGIYPDWAVFCNTIVAPITPQEKKFKKVQEAVRKDIERAFGVLQIKFRMLNYCHWWDYQDSESLTKLVKTCIILHNMVIEEEQTLGPEERDIEVREFDALTAAGSVSGAAGSSSSLPLATYTRRVLTAPILAVPFDSLSDCSSFDEYAEKFVNNIKLTRDLEVFAHRKANLVASMKQSDQ